MTPVDHRRFQRRVKELIDQGMSGPYIKRQMIIEFGASVEETQAMLIKLKPVKKIDLRKVIEPADNEEVDDRNRNRMPASVLFGAEPDIEHMIEMDLLTEHDHHYGWGDD